LTVSFGLKGPHDDKAHGVNPHQPSFKLLAFVPPLGAYAPLTSGPAVLLLPH
jgi:hypothetical protein